MKRNTKLIHIANINNVVIQKQFQQLNNLLIAETKQCRTLIQLSIAHYKKPRGKKTSNPNSARQSRAQT